MHTVDTLPPRDRQIGEVLNDDRSLHRPVLSLHPPLLTEINGRCRWLGISSPGIPTTRVEGGISTTGGEGAGGDPRSCDLGYTH